VTLDIFGGVNDIGRAAAIQPDGKIVVAGWFAGFGNATSVFALARFNPGGSVDTSFGSKGRVLTVFPNRQALANDVAIQPDGKIVVVGVTLDAGFHADFAVARYNPNGTLDTSFNSDGKLTTKFGGPDRARAVAIQPDGKIVVAGTGGDARDDYAFAFARYNPNGTLDTSFNSDGKRLDHGGTGVHGVAIQPDGRIVAAGRAEQDDRFALIRYNPNGTRDPSFSGDGKIIGGGLSEPADVEIQPDGKIVLAGSARVSAGRRRLRLHARPLQPERLRRPELRRPPLHRLRARWHRRGRVRRRDPARRKDRHRRQHRRRLRVATRQEPKSRISPRPPREARLDDPRGA
jgi:uncharacterized delta-60 repeat protein